MSKRINLMTFLKGSTKPKDFMPGCGNYNFGNCLSGEACKVEQGERCDYFERVVLPTAFDIGQADHIYSLYERRCKIKGLVKRGEARICPDCPASLGPKQKYCPDCARKRRRKTNKVNQRKYRANRNGLT